MEGINLREIGSYIETDLDLKSTNAMSGYSPPFSKDCAYTFSGRSAIELALMNIMKERNIKRVYMPSYCCSSMLQPFHKQEIDILFYQVDINKGKLSYDIDYDEEVDLFFAMSYFGVDESIDSFITRFKEQGTLVIEDITHRLLSNQSHNNQSDYLVASLRKWFAIPTGGLLVSMEKLLPIKPTKDSSHLVLDQLEGMNLKANYLQGDRKIVKQDYFNRFKEFNNHILKTNYEYKIDNVSLNLLSGINLLKIRRKRRANAKYLYSRLTEISLLEPLFENVDLEVMTPLFVPVIVQDSKIRKELLKYLVDNQIYCPVHWPKPEIIEGTLEVYDKEISLVCDQRYNQDDMDRIIEVIREFEINNA